MNSESRKIAYEGIWWSYYTYKTVEDIPTNNDLVDVWNKCFNESDEIRYMSDKKLFLQFLLKTKGMFYTNVCVYRVSAYKNDVKILNRYETIKEFGRAIKVMEL